MKVSHILNTMSSFQTIDPRIHRNIEADLKYEKYAVRMHKVVRGIFRRLIG